LGSFTKSALCASKRGSYFSHPVDVDAELVERYRFCCGVSAAQAK
jgi:hypothetical protein